jgi:hypothetical protein
VLTGALLLESLCQPLFPLVIFGVSLFAQAGLDCDPSICAPQLAGMTGAHHRAQLFLLR